MPMQGTFNSGIKDIRASSNGSLMMEIGGWNAGPFGDLITSEKQAILQMDFVYGIIAAYGAVTVANSATADTSAGRLRLQTGTNSAGSATFTSRLPARYRPGQGIVAMFTPVWDGATASCEQVFGMGTAEDGYGFGFNGTAFGIYYRSASSTTWIAQTSWNVDRCDGTGQSGFNWTKTVGNVVAVRYPFLGYGPITFWVMHPTGYWILCHTIQYPNTSASVQITNPMLNFFGRVVNSGSTTNRTAYCGSVGVFSVGQIDFASSPQWGIDSGKTGITTETNLLTLRNATTYNGVPNRAVIRIRSLSVAYDGGNGRATFRMKYGASLGGSPSYTPISGSTADAGVTITSGQSPVSYDVAGTTVTNGTLRYNLVTARNMSYVQDVTAYKLLLMPGETVTFSGTATVSGDLNIAVNWDEEL